MLVDAAPIWHVSNVAHSRSHNTTIMCCLYTAHGSNDSLGGLFQPLPLGHRLCGDFALLADMGKIVAAASFPQGTAPLWLVGYDGRAVMVLLCVLVVLPLCCLQRFSQVRTWAVPINHCCTGCNDID